MRVPENNEKPGVAIVDDEAGVVRTYELLFKRRQIPLAFTASDGMDAIEKFKNSGPKPKVVIIDYRLPSMSGVELMEKILAIEPDTKIIFISGDDSIRDGVLKAGADIFLKKPTGIKDITESVNSLLAE
jgi:two-component system chemotaxis response regulator CheY